MNSTMTTPLLFCVENNELDSHHRFIFELFDKVEAAITSNQRAKAVSEALLQLRDYASYHFGAEESLFELKAFPGSQEHVEQHLEFRSQLSELMAMPGEDETVRLKLLRFLRTWFQGHIMVRDKAYIPYLKDEIHR